MLHRRDSDVVANPWTRTSHSSTLGLLGKQCCFCKEEQSERCSAHALSLHHIGRLICLQSPALFIPSDRF